VGYFDIQLSSTVGLSKEEKNDSTVETWMWKREKDKMRKK